MPNSSPPLTEDRESLAAAPRRSLASAPLRAAEAVIVIVTVLIIVHVIVNAAGRFFFQLPLEGTFEFVENWYMVILCYLGFIVAKQRGEHIQATLIYDKLGDHGKLLFSFTANILSAAALAVLGYFSFTEALHATDVGLTSGVTAVTIWPVYWLMPVVFAVLTVSYLNDAITEFRTGKPTETTTPEI